MVGFIEDTDYRDRNSEIDNKILVELMVALIKAVAVLNKHGEPDLAGQLAKTGTELFRRIANLTDADIKYFQHIEMEISGNAPLISATLSDEPLDTSALNPAQKTLAAMGKEQAETEADRRRWRKGAEEYVKAVTKRNTQ